MAVQEILLKNKRLVTILALVLIVVIAGGFVLRARANQPNYLTAAVKRGNITAAVQATGTINPLTTVPVGSYVSGTVEYIFADFNSRVHARQVLAQLDPAIYEAQVMTARGNLGNARANLETLKATIAVDQADLAKAQADLDYTRVNARRTEEMLRQGIISQDQNDLSQSTLGQKGASVQAAQAQLNQAKAQLEQGKAQADAMAGTLKQAETNLLYTTILSPIDGTVVARNITVGQSVAAALQAPNVFTIAQDLKRMQVYAKTDESDTGSIKVGAEVSFQVDAFPGEQLHGRVSAIRLNAYSVQNVVTYDTVIDFENPQEKLLPGETAYVTIPTGHAADTPEIPNAALTFTPDMPRAEIQAMYSKFNIPARAASSHLGGWQVAWKMGADKKPEPVAVRLGITDFIHTQLLEGNLKEGDTLIVGQQSANRAPQGQGQFQGGPRGGMR